MYASNTSLIRILILKGERGVRGLPGAPPKIIPSIMLEVKGEKGDKGLFGVKGTIGLKGKEPPCIINTIY